jgi:hypothetical protein
MRIAKWALLVMFMAGFCFCVGTNVYVQIHYTNSMPRSPEPETGRIYLFAVNHDAHRYVNQRELARARFAQSRLYPLGFLCFLGLGAIKVCS